MSMFKNHGEYSPVAAALEKVPEQNQGTASDKDHDQERKDGCRPTDGYPFLMIDVSAHDVSLQAVTHPTFTTQDTQA